MGWGASQRGCNANIEKCKVKGRLERSVCNKLRSDAEVLNLIGNFLVQRVSKKACVRMHRFGWNVTKWTRIRYLNLRTRGMMFISRIVLGATDVEKLGDFDWSPNISWLLKSWKKVIKIVSAIDAFQKQRILIFPISYLEKN